MKISLDLAVYFLLILPYFVFLILSQLLDFGLPWLTDFMSCGSHQRSEHVVLFPFLLAPDEYVYAESFQNVVSLPWLH